VDDITQEKIYQFEFNGQVLKEDGNVCDDTIKEGSYLGDLRALSKLYGNGKTGNILEWGSGITSLMLADLLDQQGNGSLMTIDHNKSYQHAVCKALSERTQVTALTIDLIGPRESQADICLNYSSVPMHFSKQFDFIFIDGRRRVECALTAAFISHAETTVVIHDYRRTRYQPMLALFNVIEDGPHFRVLRVKPEILASFEQTQTKVRAAMQAEYQPLLQSKSGSEWITIVNNTGAFNV